ncbi:MAG: InlB B-repeat-containing protein, partial [Aedoeadaptatus pacaensis]
MKNILKQLCLWTLILTMVLSGPMSAFAQVNHKDLTKDKATIISKEPVTPAKLKEGQTAEQLIKNPAQPAIYTLRTDYKVQRGDKYVVDYQPYIASVGEAATQAEKDKVNKTIDLPDLAGYEKPDDDYKIDYKTVKEAGEKGRTSGNATNGLRYQAKEDFRYKAKANEITIKHVFQDLHDFSKYTNPDGTVGEKGQLITTQSGNTGSTMEVSPLDEKHPNRKGFVPEAPYITMQVPENAEQFILEYRYNRAHYDVNFDTKGGTPMPNRTLYYEQIIPKIDDKSIPTKVGSDFLGWKPSITLETPGGKTYPENEIIKDGTGEPILNLAADLKMPASKITFTAVWKDKEKADYAVQFWAEKSDHADDASIMDKYEYMGTRVYKDQDTGMRPDLDKEPVKGIKFPDLDDTRLQKIWNGDKFNRDHDLYLNKFFFYNKSLTAEQNKDPDNARVVKSVSSTGKTVYNIYYDRQVYDLYFTKSNAQPKKNTFYPEIWKYDEKEGKAVMAGGPGNLYHYKARFNEMMYKWPNDAKQTKGFTPGYQSFGWGPNYTNPNWPLHLDTPPYRLNADEFLDMANYTSWGGYTKHIDKGDGTTIDLKRFDFTTLSFGIKQDHPSIPHHMDFWMDGFKDGETIIRYDLVRTKADTAGLGYGHRYPKVQGFTPHGYDPNNPQSAWPVIREGSEENGRVNEDGIDVLNDERDEITPNNCGLYYNNNGIKLPIGQLDFISVFFSDADEYGDKKEGGQSFKENGYLQFHYKRNKYPLRFNTDPTKIKDDSEFSYPVKSGKEFTNEKANALETFYEFPLKVLSPDLVDGRLGREKREYFKEDPKNLLDNPNNAYKLGLYDLLQRDKNNPEKFATEKIKVINVETGEEEEVDTYKFKRPEGLSDQMVFKGWALDPAGTKLIWENPKETMPTHPVNLYAKWGEPDYKWKVTFDPDGGSFRSVKKENLTTSTKTIQEGDIGQEEVKTYPIKEKGDGNKQVFTVIQRQKLVEPKFVPEKKGYDFMGWEVIRYKKDAKTGDYTDEIDNSYR